MPAIKRTVEVTDLKAPADYPYASVEDFLNYHTPSDGVMYAGSLHGLLYRLPEGDSERNEKRTHLPVAALVTSTLQGRRTFQVCTFGDLVRTAITSWNTFNEYVYKPAVSNETWGSFPWEFFEFANDPGTIRHVKNYLYTEQRNATLWAIENWRDKLSGDLEAYRRYRDVNRRFREQIALFNARLVELGHDPVPKWRPAKKYGKPS